MNLTPWLLAFALAAGPAGLDRVWESLDRGDVQGATAALADAPRPAGSDAELASWLDAQSRLAWAQGRMDRAFAWGVQAVVVGERSNRAFPGLTPSLTPGRAWVDEACGLPRLVLPTGDGDGVALARELLALPEAATPEGVWIVWAARLLDGKVPAPENRSGRAAASDPRREQRQALLQSAVEARHGGSRSTAAVVASLRQPAREGSPLEGFARWFEAEALQRDARSAQPRLAALRMVQSAAALEDSPWLRVRALERAAALLDPIDPSEAARLREAARKETP
jgi:hypothetical protein